jgi:hypothetical protein
MRKTIFSIKSIAIVLLVPSLFLLTANSINFSTLEPINKDNSILIKVYAQDNATSKNTPLPFDQNLEQLQNKISELQNQYNQISNRTNNIESQLKNIVTNADLSLSLNELQANLLNEVGNVYETTNNLQDTINYLQSTVNEMYGLYSFDNCVVTAADYGAQTDLLGFAETLRNCIGQ